MIKVPVDVPELLIKPQPIFAFFKTLPLIIIAIVLTLTALKFYPSMICLGIVFMLLACYRYLYIRKICYVLTPEILRIRRGIFFKRVDTVELYRVKDYVLLQPFWFQFFCLMDLMLKTTDPENPVIWLRGIPLSDLVDTIRNHVQESRQHNKIVEIN